MTQGDLFTAPAKVARDAALKQVADNSGSFMEIAGRRFSDLFRDGECLIGEEIRARYEGAAVRPHHHNAWGALINQFVRLHRLRKTGRYRAMTGPKSHARATAEFRICIGG